MKNKVTSSIDKKEFDGRRFQLLRQSRRISKEQLAKSIGKIRSLHRFEFGLTSLFSALLCLGYVFLGGCANDSQSDDHAQHRQHHHGNRQGGGDNDRSGASQSATPIPGL